MDLRALLREDEAVSSVLGVVLMVAITIVLAAVIGTYVLGIGSDLTDSSPSAQIEITSSVSGDNGTVVLIHGGGDDIHAENVEVTIGGDTVYTDGTLRDSTGNYSEDSDNNGWDGTMITTSDRLRIENDGGDIQSGDLVLVLWESEDSSTILAEEQVG